MAVIWTQELATAVKAVALETAPSPYGWHEQNQDVKSRAAEFVRGMKVGAVMTAMHVEYFQCLRGRLDHGGPERASHKALKTAWGAAWEAAQGGAE